jgi:hypothetical protein
VVNPSADLGRLGDIGLLAYSHADSPSYAFLGIGEIMCSATSSVAAGVASAALYNFNEAAGAISFIDSSGNGLTLTGGAGEVMASATQYKYGGRALKITCAATVTDARRALSSGVQIRTSQFTIEFLVYIESAFVTDNDNTVIFALESSSNPFYVAVRQGDCAAGVNALTQAGGTNEVVGLDRWRQIAVTRDASNVLRMFVNGVLLSTASTVSTDMVNTTSGDMWIGTLYDTSSGFAYVEDLRLLVGSCLYTSSYTPTTSELI